jgi:hypothetical protein
LSFVLFSLPISDAGRTIECNFGGQNIDRSSITPLQFFKRDIARRKVDSAPHNLVSDAAVPTPVESDTGAYESRRVIISTRGGLICGMLESAVPAPL